jgi:hypothetical protein
VSVTSPDCPRPKLASRHLIEISGTPCWVGNCRRDMGRQGRTVLAAGSAVRGNPRGYGRRRVGSGFDPRTPHSQAIGDQGSQDTSPLLVIGPAGVERGDRDWSWSGSEDREHGAAALAVGALVSFPSTANTVYRPRATVLGACRPCPGGPGHVSWSGSPFAFVTLDGSQSFRARIMSFVVTESVQSRGGLAGKGDHAACVGLRGPTRISAGQDESSRPELTTRSGHPPLGSDPPGHYALDPRRRER